MTVIDIPPGWATMIAALLAAAVALMVQQIIARASRMTRLERDVQRLWLGVRLAVDLLYRNGIEPPPQLRKLIYGEEDDQ